MGALESSKSAMYTLAPELRALMTILRSTGPVISTRRSWMSSGMGATCCVAQLAWHSPPCNPFQLFMWLKHLPKELHGPYS